MLVDLIPHAVKQPQTCEETFALSHQLFKKLAETSLDTLNLMDLVSQWSALLLSHTPNEVGQSFQRSLVCADVLAEHWPPRKCRPGCAWAGKPPLLGCVFCKGFPKTIIRKVRLASQPLEIFSDRFSNIGLDLLREHLFPPLSTGEILKPRIPLLNTVTRQLISETICFLVKDDEEHYREVLSSLSELVLYDPKIEEGVYMLHLPIFQMLNIWLRPLRLRIALSPRKKQSHSISYRLRRSQKFVKHLLPQLFVHAALYECSVPRVYAYCQRCRWRSFTKVAC